MIASPDVEPEPPGRWTSIGTALQLIVGWFSVAIGILNLLVEVDREPGEPDTAYLLFHTVLVVGGLLLLSLSRLTGRGRGPGTVGYAAGAAVLAGGMVISGIPVNTTVCCLPAYAVRHGYPFTFAARADGRDPSRWHVDGQHLVADLLFWGYGGLLLLVVVALVRRFSAPSPSPDEPAAAADPASVRSHAESRPDAEQAADGGTVGPVP